MIPSHYFQVLKVKLYFDKNYLDLIIIGISVCVSFIFKEHQLNYSDLLQLFSKEQMARNSQKAQGMLNRWWAMKRNLVNKEDQERPKGLIHIRQITNLQECQKWRKQVTKEIITDVEVIQNRDLGEARIRELNDEINRKLRQLYNWQIRIKELGGQDYRTIKSAKMYDAQGYEIPGFGGYRYFGAAKDLPGVKQVFKREVPIAPERTNQQIRKVITASYFGDEEADDEELLKQEAMETQLKREEALMNWIQQNQKKIKQFYKDNEPSLQDLMRDTDLIDNFEVEVEQ